MAEQPAPTLGQFRAKFHLRECITAAVIMQVGLVGGKVLFSSRSFEARFAEEFCISAVVLMENEPCSNYAKSNHGSVGNFGQFRQESNAGFVRPQVCVILGTEIAGFGVSCEDTAVKIPPQL